MTSTGYVLPQWRPGQVAVEYDENGTPQGGPLDHPWDTDGPYWNLRGNGGILTTAADMARWHLALQGADILSTDAKLKLFTPHVLEDNGETHYGYGWVVLFDDDDRPVVWHTAATAGRTESSCDRSTTASCCSGSPTGRTRTAAGTSTTSTCRWSSTAISARADDLDV